MKSPIYWIELKLLTETENEMKNRKKTIDKYMGTKISHKFLILGLYTQVIEINFTPNNNWAATVKDMVAD